MKISECKGKIKVGDRVEVEFFNKYRGFVKNINNDYFVVEDNRGFLIGPFHFNGDDDTWLITILSKSMILDTPEKAKYGLSYKRGSDPTEYFRTLPDLKKRVDQLVSDESVDKDSIFYFRLADKVQFKPKKDYELVKII